ncbi:hypothetical protein BDV95DRAFT_556831 [Massariosphaeria phaeospora]|uniref:Uncharacterized protein n=1 Tax=Massariosphaeria phaeospora TaxID=100035 RepID=A0A7C8MJ70_9PLEO|nr:hypothetical protein BDV95DRAFT_556831 [Massariosphaeria phaeospora]
MATPHFLHRQQIAKEWASLESLGAQANGSTTQNSNAPGYESVEPITTNGEDDDDEAPVSNKGIKEQQSKRLEEQGGWLGYLKSFMIFLPDLRPKDNRRIMACLSVRFVHLMLGRALNLLELRQLGIIMTKISEDYRVMPWSDIYLWILYR